jgi:predicted amidohydrolase YtcJ
MLDLRLTNGNLVTLDPARPHALELGVWRGRIFGLDEEIAGLPARRTIDLGGATVLPGFIDPHVHLAWTGFETGWVSIAGRTTPEAALEVIAAAVADAPPGEWVDIVGYDQRSLGRHLTAAELDAISLGRKVFVYHQSGHACVVNTPVLALLPGVPHESGLLAESGMAAARAVRRPYSVDSLSTAIQRAGRICLTEGITAVAEAGIGGGMVGNSAVEAAAYQRLSEAGRLPLRVQLMVAADVLHEIGAHPADGITRGMDLGLRTGFGGDRLSLGALKIFTDGGMMARTAALTEPYTGLDHAGQFFDDPAAFAGLVLDGHRAGWQLAIHAIGDRAVDLALDALDAAQRADSRPDARHRVEHAGLVRPDQLARFAGTGAVAVIQPNFLWYLGDDYATILGPGRAPWLYRAGAFLDHGISLAASSDRPVTPGAPLRAIQVLVDRLTAAGAPIGPAERLTVDEALRAYTIGAAFVSRREHELGSLTTGKHADLVVLSEDPRSAESIADISVLATVVAGDLAHGSLG